MFAAPSSGSFPSTAWALIHIAQNAQHPDHRSARNQVFAAYWMPVFCFLRAKGFAPEQAEDVTQEFFQYFLERNLLLKADPQRGKFRGYLFQLLTWFVADQGTNRVRRQKQFERNLVSLEGLVGGGVRCYDPLSKETPETVFTKAWAIRLFLKVRQDLETLYVHEGRRIWYSVFAARHFPESPGKAPTQIELAEKFGLTREDVRKVLKQVQKRFERLLRAEVREEVGSEAEVDDEINELLPLME